MSKIILAGAGPMAKDYAKVLNSLGVEFQVITRSQNSAVEFEKAFGGSVLHGPFAESLNSLKTPEMAIVAVTIDQLAGVATALIKKGVKRILLEKPGALNKEEISQLDELARSNNVEVLIGYNRRFYASTMAAQRMIAEDGGALSCHFEFTEWAHTIEPLSLPSQVKEHWLLSNSSHVADLFLFLCGKPKEWSSWTRGKLDWHPSASGFTGAGVTNNDILFSYQADWDAPGRWGLEIMTRKRRLIFRPMEQLHVVNLASVRIDKVEIHDKLDIEFKPGLYEQTKAFLGGLSHSFCSLQEQRENFEIYYKMAAY